jgi:GTP cyclohydrolase IA
MKTSSLNLRALVYAMNEHSNISESKIARTSNPDEAVVRWVESFPNPEAACVLAHIIDENPGRITRGYAEFLSGYSLEPTDLLKTTRIVTDKEPRPGWIDISDIEFVSMCPHHFLPYFGEATVRYRPTQIILGLGKFPRFVDALARRLIIQEDLTRDIGCGIAQVARTDDVTVSTKATHMCICFRGARQISVRTIVNFTYGA